MFFLFKLATIFLSYSIYKLKLNKDMQRK